MAKEKREREKARGPKSKQNKPELKIRMSMHSLREEEHMLYFKCLKKPNIKDESHRQTKIRRKTKRMREEKKIEKLHTFRLTTKAMPWEVLCVIIVGHVHFVR